MNIKILARASWDILKYPVIGASALALFIAVILVGNNLIGVLILPVWIMFCLSCAAVYFIRERYKQLIKDHEENK